MNGRLTKPALVDTVARAVEISRDEAADIVEVIFAAIVRGLNRGERVQIRGFGSFGVRKRGARAGRNPKTGVPVVVPAKRVAFFRMSKTQRDNFSRRPNTSL